MLRRIQRGDVDATLTFLGFESLVWWLMAEHSFPPPVDSFSIRGKIIWSFLEILLCSILTIFRNNFVKFSYGHIQLAY